MRTTTSSTAIDHIPESLRLFVARRFAEAVGAGLILSLAGLGVALLTWSVQDPSLNHATAARVHNWLGAPGAIAADLVMQLLGLASLAVLIPLNFWGLRLLAEHRLPRVAMRLLLLAGGGLCAAGVASLLPITTHWPLPSGLGGIVGDLVMALPRRLFSGLRPALFAVAAGLAVAAVLLLSASVGLRERARFDDGDAAVRAVRPGRDPHRDAFRDFEEEDADPGLGLLSLGALAHAGHSARAALVRRLRRWQPRHAASSRQGSDASFDLPFDLADEPPSSSAEPAGRAEPRFDASAYAPPALRAREPAFAPEMAASGMAAPGATPGPFVPGRGGEPAAPGPQAVGHPARALGPMPQAAPVRVSQPAPAPRPSGRTLREGSVPRPERVAGLHQLPPVALLSEGRRLPLPTVSEDALAQNARLLEGVLDDFGVKGEIVNVRPGPVVTLYELEPAPGIKSSRVIGLADDIARSMSALSARVAVVPGRNAIGIELPNLRRDTVHLRELVASRDFDESRASLAIALGKNIGGEPVVVDLAKMPHLLVAGTTGSGKSVAINTMILSLLYRLRPEECRLIMVDPKMLELSVYDGIPHLLTPVVTDPKKAVVALKWAVREMEDRYKKMSKLGVRNIDGFNARVAEALARGETLTRTVQTGFCGDTGEAIYEHEAMDVAPLPFIVIIVDEMADLMMVAGKDIEGAIQRLAQMARAAGIHLIMATQRPSVDVITGTIKANFPTRISFQVTSKIDSRTILGEQGAEQLLGQGDMLHMQGGGRIYRVHGPFVADEDVERVVAHLKAQGQPDYLDAITDEEAEGDDEDGAPAGTAAMDDSADMYDRAVAVVLRDRKCSTSYIQRRLGVGYNKAASLVERMEKEGVVGAPNHSGKRTILLGQGGSGGHGYASLDRGAAELQDAED